MNVSLISMKDFLIEKGLDTERNQAIVEELCTYPHIDLVATEVVPWSRASVPPMGIAPQAIVQTSVSGRVIMETKLVVMRDDPGGRVLIITLTLWCLG